MGRAPCCDKANVKRGPWSPEEDAALRSYLEAHGTAGNWITLPKKAGLRRCGKSCRLRWLNYLRPDIKHGGFTEEEDNLIIGLYTEIGSRWSVIASQLPGRTDNDVKNYWNTKLKKRLLSGKITLPNPNSTIVATNSCSSTSSVGISNELAPPRDYNYNGFSVVSGAGLEPSIFSTLLTDVHYRPSIMVQDPSPGIGSTVDFRGNINSSASRECSSAVNSSGNSPNSLGAVDNNRSASNLANGGAVAEYGGTNFGSGFGFSWEMLINELLLDDKAGEISPNASAEVNPQVLSQSSINYQY